MNEKVEQAMKQALQPTGLNFPASRLGGCLAKSVFCTANHFRRVDFQGLSPKVSLINVDTAGRDVSLSGHEGNCVQWL